MFKDLNARRGITSDQMKANIIEMLPYTRTV